MLLQTNQIATINQSCVLKISIQFQLKGGT